MIHALDGTSCALSSATSPVTVKLVACGSVLLNIAFRTTLISDAARAACEPTCKTSIASFYNICPRNSCNPPSVPVRIGQPPSHRSPPKLRRAQSRTSLRSVLEDVCRFIDYGNALHSFCHARLRQKSTSRRNPFSCQHGVSTDLYLRLILHKITLT
jgi:hypothetical protein